MSDKLQKYEEKVPETVADRPFAAPPCDVYENDREVLLVADIPGVHKDSLKIHVEQNQLALEGRVEEPMDGLLIGREYHGVDYRRTFTLPTGIDVDKINADLKQGVLWLHLPKAEALRPRQITVKAG